MSRETLGLAPQLRSYLLSVGVREDPVLLELRDETSRLAGSGMQISPEQGQLLRFLVKVLGAKRTLEAGVFTGYSGLCVALELPPDGIWIGCDLDAEAGAVARRYFAQAGKEEFFDLRLGPAVQTFERLLEEGFGGSFDLIFIDADKENYGRYYELGLRLLRVEGVMAFDNVFWNGSVIDPSRTDPGTVAIRELNQTIHGDPRVTISMLPIGDGLTLVCKR